MQQISSSNMISQWNLDGVADLLGANPLTNVNSVPFTSGLFGKNCASLTGTNSQEFTAADSASLEVNGSQATWAMWFQPANLAGSVMGLLMKGFNTASSGGSPGQHEYACTFTVNTGAVTFRASNGTTSTTVTTGNAASFTSPNLAIWWMDSSNKLNIQLNGGTVATGATALTGGIWAGGGNGWGLNLGLTVVSSVFRYFTGLLGPLSFWKRTLTAPERALLWNGGAGFPFPFGYDQPPVLGGGLNDLVGGMAA
jgi:hypothetical protein